MTVAAIILAVWFSVAVLVTATGLIALNIADRRLQAEIARSAAVARAGNVIEFPAA